jgi:autoinducer 2-binding protein LuxP
MRRLRCFILLTVLGGFAVTAHASRTMLNLMDSDDFYQANPEQISLAEQFTSMVYSLSIPIRIPQKKTVRIAVLLFGEIDSIGNRALLLSFKKRMRELKIDYRLDTYVDRSEHGKDLEPYYKITEAQPDYIVITKFGFAQRRFVERFLRLGTPKVILYDFASPLRYWVDHPPLMYIGFDQKKATKKLASYLNRQLTKETRVSALVLADSYLGRVRCDLFLDEMVRYGRHVGAIRVVSDDKKQAFDATQLLLSEKSTDFIFSCSQNISDGVVAALQGDELGTVQTNSWGLSFNGIGDLESKRVKVSVFFMKDYLSIAAAEAIKLDLEGGNMPNLYIAHSNLVSSELDSQSLQLMAEQAYGYSVVLWQK